MQLLRSVFLEARRRGWLQPRFLLRTAAMLPLQAVGLALAAVGYPFLVFSLAVALPVIFLANPQLYRSDPKQLVWMVLGPAKMAALFFPFFAIPFLVFPTLRPDGLDLSPAQPQIALFLIGTSLTALVWAFLAYGSDALRKFNLALQIGSTATSRIRSLAAGLVEIRGTVKALEGRRHAVSFTTRYRPDTTQQDVGLFTLDDETGKVVVDAREAFVQPRWGTGNGEHVREIQLRRRVTPHSLSTPELQELLTGDQAYVLGYYNPEETMEVDGERLPVVRPRNASERATGWRTILTSPGAREGWSFAHAFLLTDGDEKTAIQAPLRAGLASALRTLFYAIPAVLMLAQFVPYVTGYSAWSVPEIETHAPPQKRGALLLARAQAGKAEALQALARNLDDTGVRAAFPSLLAAAPDATALMAIDAVTLDRVRAPEELRGLVEQVYFRLPIERRGPILWKFAYPPFATSPSPRVFQDALMQPALRDKALRALDYAKHGHRELEEVLEQVAREHLADHRLETAARILHRSRGAEDTTRFLLSLASNPPSAPLVCAVAALLPVGVPTDAFFKAALRSGAADSCLADGLAAQPRSVTLLRWFAARLTSESYTVSTHAHAYVRQERAGARSYVAAYLSGVPPARNPELRLFETLALAFENEERLLQPFFEKALLDSRVEVRRDATYTIIRLGGRASFMGHALRRALAAERDGHVRGQVELAIRRVSQLEGP